MTEQETALMKVRVFRHDHVPSAFGVFPDSCIIRVFQADISHMLGVRKEIGEQVDQAIR